MPFLRSLVYIQWWETTVVMHCWHQCQSRLKEEFCQAMSQPWNSAPSYRMFPQHRVCNILESHRCHDYIKWHSYRHSTNKVIGCCSVPKLVCWKSEAQCLAYDACKECIRGNSARQRTGTYSLTATGWPHDLTLSIKTDYMAKISKRERAQRSSPHSEWENILLLIIWKGGAGTVLKIPPSFQSLLIIS